MGMMCAGASSCISVGEMFLRFVASRCEFVDKIYAGSYGLKGWLRLLNKLSKDHLLLSV